MIDTTDDLSMSCFVERSVMAQHPAGKVYHRSVECSRELRTSVGLHRGILFDSDKPSSSAQHAKTESVEVCLEFGHRAAKRDLPTAEGFTHDWIVFVTGSGTSRIQDFIEKIEFRLHESFAKSRRIVKKPPYHVVETGYGGFTMPIDVYFKNDHHGEPKKIRFQYELFLGTTGFINHNRWEKITFHNPSPVFRERLINGGGVTSNELNISFGSSLCFDTSRDRHITLNCLPKHAYISRSNGLLGNNGTDKVLPLTSYHDKENHPSVPRVALRCRVALNDTQPASGNMNCHGARSTAPLSTAQQPPPSPAGYRSSSASDRKRFRMENDTASITSGGGGLATWDVDRLVAANKRVTFNPAVESIPIGSSGVREMISGPIITLRKPNDVQGNRATLQTACRKRGRPAKQATSGSTTPLKEKSRGRGRPRKTPMTTETCVSSLLRCDNRNANDIATKRLAGSDITDDDDDVNHKENVPCNKLFKVATAVTSYRTRSPDEKRLQARSSSSDYVTAAQQRCLRRDEDGVQRTTVNRGECRRFPLSASTALADKRSEATRNNSLKTHVCRRQMCDSRTLQAGSRPIAITEELVRFRAGNRFDKVNPQLVFQQTSEDYCKMEATRLGNPIASSRNEATTNAQPEVVDEAAWPMIESSRGIKIAVISSECVDVIDEFFDRLCLPLSIGKPMLSSTPIKMVETSNENDDAGAIERPLRETSKPRGARFRYKPPVRSVLADDEDGDALSQGERAWLIATGTRPTLQGVPDHGRIININESCFPLPSGLEPQRQCHPPIASMTSQNSVSTARSVTSGWQNDHRSVADATTAAATSSNTAGNGEITCRSAPYVQSNRILHQLRDVDVALLPLRKQPHINPIGPAELATNCQNRSDELPSNHPVSNDLIVQHQAPPPSSRLRCHTTVDAAQPDVTSSSIATITQPPPLQPPHTERRPVVGATVGPHEASRRAPNGFPVHRLLELQRKLSSLVELATLHRVVRIIGETGRYLVNEATFDFDLCNLDAPTVSALINCIDHHDDDCNQ